jgi:hypothetical protein
MPEINIPPHEWTAILNHNRDVERYKRDSSRLQSRILRAYPIVRGFPNDFRIMRAWDRLGHRCPDPADSINDILFCVSIAIGGEQMQKLGLTVVEMPEFEPQRYDRVYRMLMKLAGTIAPSLSDWPANLDPCAGLYRMKALCERILRGEKLLTSAEVAKRLGKYVTTITRRCDDGKFPGATKNANLEWQIPESSLPPRDQKKPAIKPTAPLRTIVRKWECNDREGCGSEVEAIIKPAKCPKCGHSMSIKTERQVIK